MPFAPGPDKASLQIRDDIGVRRQDRLELPDMFQHAIYGGILRRPVSGFACREVVHETRDDFQARTPRNRKPFRQVAKQRRRQRVASMRVQPHRRVDDPVAGRKLRIGLRLRPRRQVVGRPDVHAALGVGDLVGRRLERCFDMIA